MKKLIITLSLLPLVITTTFANTYVDETIDGYKFRFIKYDTLDKDYIFKIGVNLDYNASDLRTLMEKFNGISAVNGVFFCPEDYRECGGENFTKNERYFQGYKLGTEPTTGDRVVFAVSKNNFPFLYQTDKIDYNKESEIYYGLANFPLLLQAGRSKYQDYVDLGLIDAKMTSKASRNFICSTENGRYILSGYVSNIDLKSLPDILLKVGCFNALNLDAGASSAMIYNGRYIIGPGRDVLDGIVIERKGVDVKVLNRQAEASMQALKKQISNKTYEEKVAFMDNLASAINKYRSDFYEKLSVDIYNEKGAIVGYQITLKKTNDVIIVYFLNYLIKLSSDAKKEFAEEYKNYNDEENKKSGLF